MLLGDLWRAIEPWTGPVALTRRLLGRTGAPASPASATGPPSPAILAFAWFEIVSLAPDDPAVLARAVALYWLLVFALAVLEGPAWLRQGEALTLFFRFVSKIAPLWWTPAAPPRWSSTPARPAPRSSPPPALPVSAAAFVTLVLATVSFDGLHLTFWWLTRLGINPLEFPGRSAVTLPNTLGLLARLGADHRRHPRHRRARPPPRPRPHPLLARSRPGDAFPPAHRRRLPRRPLPDPLLAGLRYTLAALDPAPPPTTSPSASSPTPPRCA